MRSHPLLKFNTIPHEDYIILQSSLSCWPSLREASMGARPQDSAKQESNLNDPVMAGKGTVRMLDNRLIVILTIREVVESYMSMSFGVSRIQTFRTP
jgi:hypothetical protein